MNQEEGIKSAKSLRELMGELLKREFKANKQEKERLIELILECYQNGVYYYQILGIIFEVLPEIKLPKDYLSHLFEPNHLYERSPNKDWQYDPNQESWISNPERYLENLHTVFEELRIKYLRYQSSCLGAEFMILSECLMGLLSVPILLVQSKVKAEAIIAAAST